MYVESIKPISFVMTEDFLPLVTGMDKGLHDLRPWNFPWLSSDYAYCKFLKKWELAREGWKYFFHSLHFFGCFYLCFEQWLQFY